MVAASKYVCIFCGNAKLTKEDLISRWILKVLEDDPKTGTPGERYRKTVKEGEVVEESSAPIVRTSRALAKCVCGKCNSGWMEAIESTARPFLEPMIRGTGVALDTAAQRAVSVWATLKALVGQCTHEGRWTPPADWTKYLYEQGVPPDSWFVGITRYEGTTQVHYEGHSSSLRDKLGRAHPTITDEGIHMSFVIGHLAIKVIALRAGDLWALGANALLEIWPPSAVTLLWPPPIYVDDDTLGTFLKFEPPAGQFGPS